MKIARITLKVLFIFLTIGMSFYDSDAQYQAAQGWAAITQIKNGVYQVTGYAVNNVKLAPADSLLWKHVIFESETGSTVVADTSFWLRYGRAYFGFKTDSAQHKRTMTKALDTRAVICSFRYTLPDTGTIRLSGGAKQGAVVLGPKRAKRHFQLA